MHFLPFTDLPSTPQDDALENEDNEDNEDNEENETSHATVDIMVEEYGGAATEFEVKVNPLHGGGEVELATIARSKQVAEEGPKWEKVSSQLSLESGEQKRGSIVVGGHERSTVTRGKRRSTISMADTSSKPGPGSTTGRESLDDLALVGFGRGIEPTHAEL